VQETLDAVGAESVIEHTPADACKLLKCFDFEAVVINQSAGLDAEHQELVRELSGTPALVLCSPSAPATLLGLPSLVKPVSAQAVIGALVRLLH